MHVRAALLVWCGVDLDIPATDAPYATSKFDSGTVESLIGRNVREQAPASPQGCKTGRYALARALCELFVWTPVSVDFSN